MLSLPFLALPAPRLSAGGHAVMQPGVRAVSPQGCAANLLLAQASRLKVKVNLSGEANRIGPCPGSPRLGVRNIPAPIRSRQAKEVFHAMRHQGKGADWAGGARHISSRPLNARARKTE